MTLEFFFDYGCPFSYAGFVHLKSLIQDYPALSVELRPVEAHPAPEPRLDIQGIESWWKKRLQTYLQTPFPVGVPKHPMPRSPYVLAGLLYVQHLGGDVLGYSDIVFDRTFQQAKDIERPEVLEEIAKAAGLSAPEFLKAVVSQEYQEKVRKGSTYAYTERQIAFVPTYIVGEQRLEAIEARGVTPQALADFLKTVIQQSG